MSLPRDRLSRLFVNARVNLSRYADLTASYSSGRGMDYHQFLLELSQNPSFRNSEIERFFYNTTYGVRFGFTPLTRLRFHLSRQESGQQDAGIRNHTTGFGFAAGDVLHSGITLYGDLQPEPRRCFRGRHYLSFGRPGISGKWP